MDRPNQTHSDPDQVQSAGQWSRPTVQSGRRNHVNGNPIRRSGQGSRRTEHSGPPNRAFQPEQNPEPPNQAERAGQASRATEPTRARDIADPATRELPPTYNDTVDRFDRLYHAYSLRYNTYDAPTDDEEEWRLNEQHELLKQIFSSRETALFADSIEDTTTTLDCGFGTGLWAVELAESYEEDECSVIAIDVNPIMRPDSEPDNLELQVADLNEPLTFDNAEFSFVHSRFIAAGLGRARWPSYLTDIKRTLRRGGWVQLTEWDLNFRSSNGYTDNLSTLKDWAATYKSALDVPAPPTSVTIRQFQRKHLNVAPELEQLVRTAGFTDVSVDVQEVPIGPWPPNARDRAIGEQFKPIVESLIQSAGIISVVGHGLATREQYAQLANAAIAELRDVSNDARPYIKLYTVCGMKP